MISQFETSLVKTTMQTCDWYNCLLDRNISITLWHLSFGGLLQRRILLWENGTMVRSNRLECFMLLFYGGSIVVCLGVAYEYESILLILIDVIF
jgi:hypothetical protein